MKFIREELRSYDASLKQDIDEFNNKLDLTRKNLINYIDRQIEYLINVKREYNNELNYLDEENKKTCKDNQERFNQLCLLINQNDQNPTIITKIFGEFQQTFPMRPNMLKSIPEFIFQDIDKNDIIKTQKSYENEFEQNSLKLPTIDHGSSSMVSNDQFLTENIKTSVPYPNDRSELLHSSVDQHSFTPINTLIDNGTNISAKLSGSMGFSHHKQFAEQNNEEHIEPQSRLVSTCSTRTGPDRMIDLLFRIPYEHDRTPRLIVFNEEETYLLIYSLFSHQLEYLYLNSRQISSIHLPFSEHLFNLGYFTYYHSFYFSTRQTNRFVLFRLNQQEIEIEREIELINENDHFISVHIYENFVFFLYLSSPSVVMFGKYDLEKSSFLPSISFERKLYDYQEKSTYTIIDFAISNSYISFLTRLKHKDKFLIIIHDYDTMDKLHSFELIDAIKPFSIISIEKKSMSITTAMSNNEMELLLFVNDPKSHLIHCCTHQEYLRPIQGNTFGICSLNNGNLALVGSRDIRGLQVQDYLKRNKV